MSGFHGYLIRVGEGGAVPSWGHGEGGGGRGGRGLFTDNQLRGGADAVTHRLIAFVVEHGWGQALARTVDSVVGVLPLNPVSEYTNRFGVNLICGLV